MFTEDTVNFNTLYQAVILDPKHNATNFLKKVDTLAGCIVQFETPTKNVAAYLAMKNRNNEKVIKGVLLEVAFPLRGNLSPEKVEAFEVGLAALVEGLIGQGGQDG